MQQSCSGVVVVMVLAVAGVGKGGGVNKRNIWQVQISQQRSLLGTKEDIDALLLQSEMH